MDTPYSQLSRNQPWKPSHQDLGSLGFGFHCNKIPVRVLAEWNSCSSSTYYEMMVNYILLDAQDKKYWAIVDLTNREQIQTLLCVGLLCHISNFRIAPAATTAPSIDTDRVIIITKKTIVADLHQSCGISRFKYDFCFSKMIVPGIGHPAIPSDVCGVVRSVGNVEYGTNDIERLDLILITSRLSALSVRLWGIKTALFEMNFRDYRQKNVVAIITYLVSQQKNGTLYLSSTQATTISFNPKHEKAKNLGKLIAQEYGEFICPIPCETYCGTFLIPDEVSPTLTLSDILASSLWIHQRFYCTVTIVNVVLYEQKRTVYCNSCEHRVEMDTQSCYCQYCGRNYVTRVKSLGIPILVKDNDCTAMLIIRGRELKQLTGFHINDFLKYYEKVKDNYRTHCCIRRIIGSTCTFELELAPATYTNAVGDLLIKRIVQYTQLRTGQALS